MKVLWLAGNPGLYANDNAYNGGGWIASLQHEIIKNQCDIQLEVAFPWHSNFEEECDGIRYYGIKRMVYSFINYKTKQNNEYKRIKEIIELSKPDLIHVFGTELSYGMVCRMTKIPVVIHIQGILSSIKEFWLPINFSWKDYFVSNPRRLITYINLNRSIIREKVILKECKYLMGRTEWDKNTASVLSPDSKYYICNEMLRPIIYNSVHHWKHQNREIKTIISVISSATYKGSDVILKTASILKNHLKNNFEWRVYGIHDLKFAEKITGINPDDVNVKPCGVITAEQLILSIIDADIFVHPSYIENSPNTVCEAQLLGIPIIATDVGGVSSIITNNVDGILVPSHDIYMIAGKLLFLYNNKEEAIRLGKNARSKALLRHSPLKIINELLYIYNQIYNENNC